MSRGKRVLCTYLPRRDPPSNVADRGHECSFHNHYDERFATQPIISEDRARHALKVLLQTYLATCRDLGIETWLMHGTLLGWWWNKQILPWDTDADVMVSEPSIYRLAANYNMTTYHYRYPAIPKGRSFQLEVNPHYTTRGEDDKLNVVDARWIDMENGLFIDITTARYDMEHPNGAGVLTCKDGHEFRVRRLSGAAYQHAFAKLTAHPLFRTHMFSRYGIPLSKGFRPRSHSGIKSFLKPSIAPKLCWIRNFTSQYALAVLTPTPTQGVYADKIHGSHVFKDDTMEWVPAHPKVQE